jgi:diamine N-acetyltransferase
MDISDGSRPRYRGVHGAHERRARIQAGDVVASVTLVLQGSRLRLRPWRHGDLPVAQVWSNDPESLRWADAEPREHWTLDEIEQVYRSVSSRGYAFIAFLGRRQVGEFILTFNGPQPLSGRLDLVVHPAFRRLGLGREGAALCTDFAFRVLGLRRLYAYVGPGNRASMSLFRSLGFRRTSREAGRPFVLANTALSLRRLRAQTDDA